MIVQRLNPLTAAIALVCSLFAPVRYWRAERVPRAWLRRFQVLDPAEYFSVEEWHRAIEAAYGAYVPGAFRGAFAMSREQARAIAFEERFLFAEMARRSHPGITPRHWPLLDRLWDGVLAAGRMLKVLEALFRRAGTAGDAPCSLFWAGISASEVAHAERRLSFSFALERGLVDARECVYFLPAVPPPAAQERLRRLGVRWTTMSAFGFLPLGARLAALAALAGCILRGDRFAAESVPWLAAARALGCRAYLTSVSTAWPESAHVEALRAAGVRTVNWSYGANTFNFSVAHPEFRDVAVLRSLSLAEEVWVWNKGVERWLRRRALGAPPAIRATGPVMSGDSRWLAKTPPAAREEYGLPQRKLIAVFDVPPVTRDKRLAIGHGPTVYPLEMLEQFFRDVEALLAAFPGAGLVLKPKRSLAAEDRDFAHSMQRMLRSGRVVALPHDVDPYIPVAIADVCIGVPFTSPVIAALVAGRGGVFHDPDGSVARVPGAPELLAHVTRGADELRERVSALLQRPEGPQLCADPAEVFGRLLASVTRPSASR